MINSNIVTAMNALVTSALSSITEFIDNFGEVLYSKAVSLRPQEFHTGEILQGSKRTGFGIAACSTRMH